MQIIKGFEMTTDKNDSPLKSIFLENNSDLPHYALLSSDTSFRYDDLRGFTRRSKRLTESEKVEIYEELRNSYIIHEKKYPVHLGKEFSIAIGGRLLTPKMAGTVAGVIGFCMMDSLGQTFFSQFGGAVALGLAVGLAYASAEKGLSLLKVDKIFNKTSGIARMFGIHNSYSDRAGWLRRYSRGYAAKMIGGQLVASSLAIGLTIAASAYGVDKVCQNTSEIGPFADTPFKTDALICVAAKDSTHFLANKLSLK